MKVIGIEEHFVTSEIRAVWMASAIGQERTGAFDLDGIETRLDDLSEKSVVAYGREGNRCPGAFRDNSFSAQS